MKFCAKVVERFSLRKLCSLKRFPWVVAVVIAMPIVAHAEMSRAMTVTSVDPLVKVLRSDTNWPACRAEAESPRGGHATLQFVVRAPADLRGLHASVQFRDAALTAATSVRFVGYAHVKDSYSGASSDVIKSPDKWYPDPLLEDATVDVPANQAQAVWITVAVPSNQPPGRAQGVLKVEAQMNGKPVRLEEKFRLEVSPVVLTGPKLHVVNWWNYSPDNLARLTGYPVKEFSGEYWAAIEQFARMQADYGQDTIFVSPIHLTRISKADDKFQFDFSNFDRMVEIFRQAGVNGRITGEHLGGRAADPDWGAAPFILHVPPEAGAQSSALTDTNVIAFYSAFLPALRDHLQAKGWLGIYLQHIADEPTAANARSYHALCDFVREHGRGLKFIDAVHSPDSLTPEHGVAVPQLDIWHANHAAFDRYAAAGGEVWFYTCMYPRGSYANRFIEQPLILTRLLHWLNARYHAAGYLHWGYNQWQIGGTNSPFEETQYPISEGGSVMPGGDCWIVYPKNGRLLASIRLEAMRDGLEDWQLLQLLKQKNPGLAERLMNETVLDFDHYDTDINHLRTRRHEMLDALGTTTVHPAK